MSSVGLRAVTAPPVGGRQGHPPSAVPAGGIALLHAFARLFCEIEAGRRPPRHLRQLMCPLLYARLRPVWVRGGEVRRVIRIVACRTVPTRVDATILLRSDSRVGALAVAVTRRGDRWVVVEAARPEDGPLQLPWADHALVGEEDPPPYWPLDADRARDPASPSAPDTSSAGPPLGSPGDARCRAAPPAA